MPNSSPQASAALTGTSLEMSPGSLLLKGITILFLSLFSVTGGAVFKNISLSLLRCSFALQPSHIANCSYHHSEMLQSICWIHRVKSERRNKVIWCGFQIEKKKMFLSVHLLIVMRILAHLYSSKYNDLYRNRYTGLLWMRKIISQILFEPVSQNIIFFIWCAWWIC